MSTRGTIVQPLLSGSAPAKESLMGAVTQHKSFYFSLYSLFDGSRHDFRSKYRYHNPQKLNGLRD